MRYKFNSLLAVILIIMTVTGCNKDGAKYVSSGDYDLSEAESENTLEEDNEESQAGYELTGSDFDYASGQNGQGNSLESDFDNSYDAEELIPVYVCGAVQNPGVYYMNPMALKEDALKLAGGFLPEAAVDYINLAETVRAGEKIYFPYAYELDEGYNMSTDQVEQGTNRLVNINTATKDELMTLPGIGESKAEAIIKYREKNGPFQNIEDITNIPGIKEGVYNNIKEHIVVS